MHIIACSILEKKVLQSGSFFCLRCIFAFILSFFFLETLRPFKEDWCLVSASHTGIKCCIGSKENQDFLCEVVLICYISKYRRACLWKLARTPNVAAECECCFLYVVVIGARAFFFFLKTCCREVIHSFLIPLFCQMKKKHLNRVCYTLNMSELCQMLH